MSDTRKQKNYSVCITDDALQYTTNETPPVKRKIVTAANLHESGLMLVGARHWSPAMRSQLDAVGSIPAKSDKWKQGFIDQFDQFLSRSDAKRIALKNGQKLIGDDWGHLFSENLH